MSNLRDPNLEPPGPIEDNHPEECDYEKDDASSICSDCRDHASFCAYCGWSDCCGAKPTNY